MGSAIGLLLPWKGALLCCALAAKLQYLLYSDHNPWDAGKELNWLQKIFCNSVASFARFWHGYEIHGLEDLHRLKGNLLLVGYHSRCTLDLFYLFCTLRCNVLASYLFFTVQVTRTLLPLLSIVPSKSMDGGSTDEEFVRALTERPEPLMLLPGGAWECLKQSSAKGKIIWKEIPGFARVIHSNRERLGSNTKVVAFYTRNCERCLWSTDAWYDMAGQWSATMYDQFKEGQLLILPLMLLTMITSIGFSLLPVPCKVETYFSDPLVMDSSESPEAFAERVRQALQDLADRVERTPVHVTRTWSRLLAMIPYGLYVLVQNVVLYALAAIAILSTIPPMLCYILYAKLLRNEAGSKRKQA